MATRLGDGAVSPAKLAKKEEPSAATAAPLGVAAASASSLQPAAAASAKVAGQIFPIEKLPFPITQPQIDSARDIIKTLAETGILDLLKENVQADLKVKGNALNSVHPLCLLWALFGHRETKERLAILQEKNIVPGTTIWDIVLGYSNFVSEDKDSEKKGYGLSLEKFYGGKSLEEAQGDFGVFYEALRLDPEVMNPFLEEALKTLPTKKEEAQASSGWGLSALAARATKALSTAFSVGAWDPFLRALLQESSYIKVKKD